MDEPLATIGEVARRAGVATATVRYYERRWLLAADERRSGQRRFREPSLRWLVFIGMLKDAGLSLEDVAGILAATANEEWKAIARERLVDLDEEIARLEQARSYLEDALLCRCDHPVDECRIMNAEIGRRRRRCPQPGITGGCRWAVGARRRPRGGDGSRRDDRIPSALETGTFPTAASTRTERFDLGADAGGSVQDTATGELTIHGSTRPVDVPIEAQPVDGTIAVVGSTEITPSHCGVTVPFGRFEASLAAVDRRAGTEVLPLDPYGADHLGAFPAGMCVSA